MAVGARALPRLELTEPEQLLDPQQEAGAADPTDQNGDLHIARQYCPTTTPVSTTEIDDRKRKVMPSVIDTPIDQNNRNAEISSRDDMEMRHKA
ncbi:hypothetical protein MHEI_09030 [Mycobacterium heidelbergense]|nr:hypothetical protein MHEI_09030 [Mycobacterium heidelbergense]